MLVVSRRKGERVVLEVPGVGRVEVLVSEVRGDKVRLGIEAPRHVVIDRAEVHEAKRNGA